MSYTDRLSRLKLPTLKYRRLRGDMIEVFKVAHDLYDPDVSLNLAYHSGTITTGNKYKLIKHRFHYDQRKYTIFLHVLLIFGIVYQTTSSPLILSTYLKHA